MEIQTKAEAPNIPFAQWIEEELKYLKHMWRHKWRHEEYYQRNRDTFLRKVREYRQANVEKVRLCQRNSHFKHATARKQKAAQYYRANRQSKIEYAKQYRSTKSLQVAASKKAYASRNREKINAWQREKYASDIQFKIAMNIRSRINDVLRARSIPSSNKPTIDFVGICNKLSPFPKELHRYHIDHIIPLSHFDLTDPEQFKKAVSPENHQWLLAEENLRKGNRIALIDNYKEVEQNGTRKA